MKILDVFKHNTSSIMLPPYVIAEAGVNHEGRMELAKRLIEEAAEGGAHAIKFQTYKAETIASKNSPSYWDTTKVPTKSQFELFKKYDSFWKGEYEELKEECDKVGIEFMSTPFDVESAKFLNDLMPIYKISSSDITNLPFIEFLCEFGKPILLSTGASYLWEIQQAVEVIQNKKNELCLLHCILNYPTDDENANLGMIHDLKLKFPNTLLGYSDHTLPKDMKALELATVLGAKVLEKHFTHDKTLPGNDHYHAMDKEDLKMFNMNMIRVQELMGSYNKYPLKSEEPARKNARRSLVFNKSLDKGSLISKEDLTWKRPAHGVSPKDIAQVCGRILAVDIAEDDLVQWNQLV
ncbi:MAG: N-acetylneuraminate synthase family protein [Flavobacteriales bacterium]|nr:N-acetylneuraminate synthase family protein [Flavobacteriales bacterium]